MHNVTVTYKDLFTNEDRSEVMYFHLTAFELAEMAAEYGSPEDFSAFMSKAFSDKATYSDGFKALQALFLKSYGRRQEGSDGRARFVKDPEWLKEMRPSPEFEEMFLRLSTDHNFAANFWNSLVSPDLIAKATELQQLGAVETVKTELSSESRAVESKPKRFDELSDKEKLEKLQAKIAAKGITVDDE